MNAIFPLRRFDPNNALPEHFVQLSDRELSVHTGTVIRLGKGEWGSVEDAIKDPSTLITYNGIVINPWQLKMLRSLEINFDIDRRLDDKIKEFLRIKR